MDILEKITILSFSFLFLMMTSFLFAPPAESLPTHMRVSDIYIRAHRFYTEKNYRRSAELLKEALSLDNDYWPAYYLLGHIYNRTGEYAKALSSYKKCVECNPPEVISQHCEVAIGHTRIILYRLHLAT